MGDCSRAYSEKENMYAISFKHRSCFCLVKLFNSPHTTTTKLNWRVFDKGGYQLSSLVAIVGPRSRSGITRGWTPAPLHLPGPERQIKILPHTTTHRLPSRNRSPTKTTSRVVHRPANERVVSVVSLLQKFGETLLRDPPFLSTSDSIGSSHSVHTERRRRGSSFIHFQQSIGHQALRGVAAMAMKVPGRQLLTQLTDFF